MQLKDFAATLRRRWYLVLVSLLCTAAATFFIVTAVGPTYQAKSTVLMMPPGTSTQQADNVGNPLLQLGSLAQARDVLIRVLTSQATSDVLCKPQSDPVYEGMRAALQAAPRCRLRSHAGLHQQCTDDPDHRRREHSG